LAKSSYVWSSHHLPHKIKKKNPFLIHSNIGKFLDLVMFRLGYKLSFRVSRLQVSNLVEIIMETKLDA
jgi:hypothetical protein